MAQTRHRRRRVSARTRRRRILAAVVVFVVGVAAVLASVSRNHHRPVATGRSASATGVSSPSGSAATSPSSSTRKGSGVAPGSSTTAGYPLSRLRAAVGYADRHDMDSSIAVIDTSSGAQSIAGDPDRLFPTASVVKTLIATRVLLDGRMSGHTAELAYTMITRSDNDDAYALYPQVGGDGLLPWIARHYGISSLGHRPAHPGLWGSTRITAVGMARFYAAVRADPKVWPWLSNAMHHHQPVTTAGEPNDFGLAALSDTAVKNGWNTNDDTTHPDDAQINSTGFVDHDRYAVVILSEGPDELYFIGGERIVTGEAKRLFPPSD